MGKVISVISQKGGVGKSTVTTLLANIFHFKYKLKICVLDCDFPQTSIMKRRRKELEILENSTRLKNIYNSFYPDGETPYTIHPVLVHDAKAVIDELQQEYDVVFVDAPGTINLDEYKSFLMGINYFLLPCLQDDFSYTSTIELYNFLVSDIKMSSSAYEDCMLFFNKVPAQNILNVFLTVIKKAGINVSDLHLRAYSDYERNYRSTVFPIPHKANSRASVHLYEFVDYIYNALQLTTTKEFAHGQ